MTTDHTYYLTHHRQVFGPQSKVPDTIIFLVATYLRLLPVDKEPQRYDGISIFKQDGQLKGFAVVLGNVQPLEIPAHLQGQDQ